MRSTCALIKKVEFSVPLAILEVSIIHHNKFCFCFIYQIWPHGTPCRQRPLAQYERQSIKTELSHRSNTMIVFFFAAEQNTLLYLPTQIRFLIGGERVTCHGSNLHDALGRSKLHNALGKQLELSTRTWSGRAPWNGGKFVCQSAWCQKAIDVGQRFSLEKAFIILQAKWFIIR